MPEEVRRYLIALLAKNASKGGKKRWEGVSKEERSKITRKAGIKSGQARAAKKQKKKKE